MHSPMKFRCGKVSRNRFVLAPLTNQQSHDDGTLSVEESHWLGMRAEGGFGVIITCAAFISTGGIGFAGQLGVIPELISKPHLELNERIHAHDSLSLVQLYHGGNRVDLKRIQGQAVSPMGNADRGVKQATTAQIQDIQQGFVEGAVLAKQWGYDGVQLHAAHGYLLCDFLSSTNQRSDEYGGSLENRSRLLLDLVQLVRERCGESFVISVRLSPERFGIDTEEILAVAQRLIDTEMVDLLDWSLWDVQKVIEGRSLLQMVLELDYGDTQMSVAGRVMSAEMVSAVLNCGVDAVAIGRGAILHHDFPQRCMEPTFQCRSLPVSVDTLRGEGLSTAFIDYMRRWENFVQSSVE